MALPTGIPPNNEYYEVKAIRCGVSNKKPGLIYSPGLKHTMLNV